MWLLPYRYVPIPESILYTIPEKASVLTCWSSYNQWMLTSCHGYLENLFQRVLYTHIARTLTAITVAVDFPTIHAFIPWIFIRVWTYPEDYKLFLGRFILLNLPCCLLVSLGSHCFSLWFERLSSCLDFVFRFWKTQRFFSHLRPHRPHMCFSWWVRMFLAWLWHAWMLGTKQVFVF